jgi:hypothetical protein
MESTDEHISLLNREFYREFRNFRALRADLASQKPLCRSYFSRNFL